MHGKKKELLDHVDVTATRNKQIHLGMKVKTFSQPCYRKCPHRDLSSLTAKANGAPWAPHGILFMNLASVMGDRRSDFLNLGRYWSRILLFFKPGWVTETRHKYGKAKEQNTWFLGSNGRNVIKLDLSEVVDGYLKLSRNWRVKRRIHWMRHWWAGASWSEATLDEMSIPAVQWGNTDFS